MVIDLIIPLKMKKISKKKIKSIWLEVATEVTEIKKALKQIKPRLEAVEKKKGHSIKVLFG